jgi:hypothetical protein
MAWKPIFATVVIVWGILAVLAYAEDIKSYSDCDVCPSSIHYGPDEARKLLGEEGFSLIARLKQFERINVNVDEVLSSDQPGEPDKPYAIKLHGDSLIIYLQDSIDESYVQMVTDYLRVRQTGSRAGWQPEIYVGSSKANAVDLSDSVDVAWTKIKESNIYQWVIANDDNIPWTDALNKRLLEALKILEN